MKTNLLILAIGLIGATSAFAGNFDELERVIRSKGNLSTQEYRDRVGYEIVRAVKSTDRQMHKRIIDLTTDVPEVRDLNAHAQFSRWRADELDGMTIKVTELRKILKPVLRDGGATSDQIKVEADLLKQNRTIIDAYDYGLPDYKFPAFNPALERAIDGLAFLHVVFACKLPL